MSVLIKFNDKGAYNTIKRNRWKFQSKNIHEKYSNLSVPKTIKRRNPKRLEEHRL